MQNEEPSNNYNDWDEKIEQCERNILDCKKEIKMLRSYRTAYDVDKVLVQLEEASEHYECENALNGTDCQMILMEQAIDIVKEGGLNDSSNN